MKAYYISGAALFTFLGMALMPLQASASTKYPRPHEVNNRLENQHDRIQQGVKSGELTRREAETLRLKDARVHSQELRDRITHNGHLTSKEYAQLNHELNRNSGAIYRDKHNARTR